MVVTVFGVDSGPVVLNSKLLNVFFYFFFFQIFLLIPNYKKMQNSVVLAAITEL